MTLGHGASEPLGLHHELVGARPDGEQSPQEVFGSGVLVEPAGQIADAGIDLVALHDRRIQE